jgi:branched-chain amino acid transport system ATP-binding protein
MLNEPLSSARAVETLSGLLADGGMTVLLVEHDMEVVFSLANKITVLHPARSSPDGTPEAIKNDAEVQRA